MTGPQRDLGAIQTPTAMPTSGQARPSLLVGGAALGGLASASVAALAGLCCAGPVTVLLLGAGGAVAAAGLEPYRLPLLLISGVLIVAGYLRAYWIKTEGPTCSIRVGRWIRTSLSIATAAWLLGAALWVIAR